jgi:hypothetical protein
VQRQPVASLDLPLNSQSRDQYGPRARAHEAGQAFMPSFDDGVVTARDVERLTV